MQMLAFLHTYLCSLCLCMHVVCLVLHATTLHVMLAHDHTEHSTCSLMHKILTLQSHPDMQNKTHHMHTQAQGAQIGVQKGKHLHIAILL